MPATPTGSATALLLAVALAACSGPTATPTATATATATATPAATPAVPSPSAVTLLRAATAIEPAQRIPLAPGVEVVVDPAARFELELSGRVPDARVVLLDAHEELVPAMDATELGTATRLSLVPASPLVPAARYALRLEGAGRRELHDAAGRSYTPASLALLAAGTPPPPAPKRKPARRRRP